MEAVSKALAILSSDDAHDLFTKTFNAALLQKEGADQKVSRAKASQLLKKVAKQNNNPRLAALARSLIFAPKSSISFSIEKMVADLEKEQADEVKHKDFCVEEINTIERETEATDMKESTLEEEIQNLQELMDKLSKEHKAYQSPFPVSSFVVRRRVPQPLSGRTH
jgi:chromosome segregation ATPase